MGLPNFTIVGLTDRAIQEARERVRASIRNAGFQFPQRRLTVNLAPAEVPPRRAPASTAIAMAILCLDNRTLRLDGHSFIGELALDGSVRPVTGVLPMAAAIHNQPTRRRRNRRLPLYASLALMYASKANRRTMRRRCRIWTVGSAPAAISRYRVATLTPRYSALSGIESRPGTVEPSVTGGGACTRDGSIGPNP